MRILVTAGNTQVPIDRVRCITNIFTGRTGTRIALYAHDEGHDVCLMTSHPSVVDELRGALTPIARWVVKPFRTFDELHRYMESAIRGGSFDAVIHCAAVSDYLSDGIFAPAPGTGFDADKGAWSSADGVPRMAERTAAKVKSNEPELWLRLMRAPKIVNLIRSEWGYQGVLVKFKLEVGIDEAELRHIAEAARRESTADLMVANTLEGSDSWALVGLVSGEYTKIDRNDLARRLIAEVERLHGEQRHG